MVVSSSTTLLLMTIPFPSICEVAQFINLWITDSLSWLRYSGSIARDSLPCKWFIKEGLTGECGKEVGEMGQTGECTQQEWNVRQSSLRISLKETQDCDLSLRVALILGRELELSCSWTHQSLVNDFPRGMYIPRLWAFFVSQMGSKNLRAIPPKNHRYWLLEAGTHQTGVRKCTHKMVKQDPRGWEWNTCSSLTISFIHIMKIISKNCPFSL